MGRPKLHTPQCVLAGKIEHGPCSSDEFVRDGQTSQRNGGCPRGGGQPEVTGRVDVDAGHAPQPVARIDATDAMERERGGGDDERTLAWSGRGYDEGVLPIGRVAQGKTVHLKTTGGHRAWRMPLPDGREHDPCLGCVVQPEGVQDDVAQGGRRDVAGTLAFEEGGDSGARFDGQRLRPPDLLEGRVEGPSRVPLRGVADAPCEQLEVLAVHQRSFPRSRRRRAMMLR